MKKYIYLVSIAVVLVLNACNSKSLKSKYGGEDHWKSDINILVDKEIITIDDKDRLTKFIDRTPNDSLVNRTYEELLTKIETERTERKKKLNESVTVSIVKKYSQYNWGDEYLLLDITIQNNTDRAIAGFTVNIDFINTENTTFYSAWWSVPLAVNAKSKVKNTLSTGKFDNNNTQQAQLKMADLSKVSIEYEIKQIIYDDGTSLSLDNN
jgi:hypothetical protein